MINNNFNKWFKLQKKNQKINVRIKKLNNLDNWNFKEDSIYHKSRKFFKIIAIDVKSNLHRQNWDQPIIVQKELGILGIIKDSKKKKYLLQAKLEPGNKNKLQLSPTVQATKSNYTRVHGGKKIPYLNFFLRKKNFFISQSEQGYRYLFKFNNNSLIKVDQKIKILKNYYWLDRSEIKSLINKKSILNMDTISVFSSFISTENIDTPLNTISSINKWFKHKDKLYKMKIKIKSLTKLRDWDVKNEKIVHKNNNHFSVIGINIRTNKREILEWDQPIIKGKNLAFVGYLIKKFNGTNHYLCRYNKKPGLKSSTLSCTVNTSNLNSYKKNKNLTIFQKNILKNLFMNKKQRYKKLYDNILSDEGGRFFNCEIRYKALEINDSFKIKIPQNYIWISQNQMIEMIKKKKIDIEARLLFACININKIK